MLIYIATFIVISLLFNALWFYAAHKGRLLAREADPRVVRAISRAYPLGPVWYAIAFGMPSLVSDFTSSAITLSRAVSMALSTSSIDAVLLTMWI